MIELKKSCRHLVQECALMKEIRHLKEEGKKNQV
jgi:hypothetical protein